MSANFEVLQAFMKASKAKDHDAFVDLWHDEMEYYWSVHAKPITSKEKLRKFIRNYEAAFDQQDWTVVNWIEKGDLMFCEGIEMIYDKSRDTLIRNPFMQAIEFRDGKVAKMRDYYDGSVVQAPQKPQAEGAAA
ncbi:MAG: nuclear transport factor 2 family protein [Brevundimonas sp.]|uniref:nuclear transport factor 2 family protein n=1 Tax=Brevundimonas sp. TaxID=1871086 RepID=UPI00403387B1